MDFPFEPASLKRLVCRTRQTTWIAPQIWSTTAGEIFRLIARMRMYVNNELPDKPINP